MSTPKWVFALLLLLAIAAPFVTATAGNVRLILMVDKSNVAALSKAVTDAKGSVQFTYKYTGAVAVTIPAEQMAAIVARPDVQRAFKDAKVDLPSPRPREGHTYGSLPLVYTESAAQIKALSAGDLQAMLNDQTNNYYPYENQLTRAYQFSAATHHFGENVIVGIIDAGVSSAAVAVASRIVGAENFTTDGIPGDSPLNSPHGTWVACCVGANALFGFQQSSAFLQAVKAYLPGSVIPNAFGPGIDGVPMVGQAPLAKFYALKVFPAGANSTSRSIIAAALERAIELKENFNKGQGGVNIQIVNLSLGGLNLFAGNDPFYAPLVSEAGHAGIVFTISAGNDGPAGLTVGTPGDSKNILSVGATSDALHSRILGDLAVGPGLGAFYRPVNNNMVIDFSSRGPTADGRMEPNIVAPGDWRYAQGADGFISLVSGTSFSAPTVAGAAALLLSAHPKATPDQIRGALLRGANPNILNDQPQRTDQGFGFLDVQAANASFGSFNPPDFGLSTPLLQINVLPFGIVASNSSNFSGRTGWLVPGQRKEFYIQTTDRPLSGLTVQVSVTPEKPPAGQNQLFGDDAEVTVATAKTSFGDYRFAQFVAGSKTIALQEDDLDMGLTRVTVTGDFTNAGRVKADVQVIKNSAPGGFFPVAAGGIAQGEVKNFPLSVPPGIGKARFALEWFNGWEAWPTNDLDVLFTDPQGNLVLTDPDLDGDVEGLSLDAPERVTLTNPAAGQWTMTVIGATVWNKKADFVVFSDLFGHLHAGNNLAKTAGVSVQNESEFALQQNSPNPFNPSTVIAYSLQKDVHVQLAVYNTLGQQVASLVNEDQQAGDHRVVFQNPGLASGVYIYRLQAGSFQATKKLVLLK
jgi:subtilisin family serine protease